MMLVFNVEPNPKHIFIWSWSVCVRVGRLASFIKHMTMYWSSGTSFVNAS